MRLDRRRRSLLLTAAATCVGVVALLALARALTEADADAPYLPGEELEGLTAALERPIPPDHPAVTFTDVSAQVGITFRHFPGTRSTRLVEDMGSGAAWGDYDGDGWLDLYVVNQDVNEVGPGAAADEDESTAGRAALYRNLGDGSFEDVTRAAGVAHAGIGMAAAWADYDGDGATDLLVSAFGGLTLYRNRGNGTFEDATARAGMDDFGGFWAGVSWADYDGDGDLDVYVTGYVRWVERDSGVSAQYDTEQPTALNPSAFDPERNLLFRNDGGVFTEVAEAAGVAGAAGRSLSASWSDLNGDGLPDLYVANDVSDNALYVNLGDGTFEERSHVALVADYRGAMGIGVGDWNEDGDQDLFITHWIAQENALFDNRLGADAEPGALLQFMDEADRHGLGQSALDFIGWGTSFFDYDNDGRLDLFVANGSTFQRDDDPTRLVPMRDQLYWNAGPERGFFEVSPVAGPHFANTFVGRGAAFGDYDEDGDVDVFVVNHQGPGVLLRNDGHPDNAWVQVALVGPPGNPAGLGGKIRVVADGVVRVREIGAQPSYLSQNSPVEHVGLGGASIVDSLIVTWPGGQTRALSALPVRRRITVPVDGQPSVARPRGGEGRRAASLDTTVPGSEEDRVRAFWALYRAAQTARIEGRMADAARAYRRALALDPDHEDALYYLGNVLAADGHGDEAREAWHRLVAVNPRSARAYGSLGVLDLCSGNGPDALARADSSFRRAASINREETGPHLRLAEVAVLRGDASTAEREVRAVLGSNPNSPQALFLEGYLAWAGGRAEEARQAHDRSVEARAPDIGDGLESGEGDTRTDHGAAPACPAMLGEVAASAGSAPTDADEAYRRLARLIEELRRR